MNSISLPWRILGLLLVLLNGAAFALSAPTFTERDIDFGIQNEGVAWSTVLTDYVHHDDGDTLTFTATGLPGWMKFDPATNKLSGNPGHDDAGNYSGIKLTVTGQAGSDSATAHGTVKAAVHPPSWVSHDPIPLGADATEGEDFSFDLTQYVLNPEGATIQYSLASALAPAWLHVAQSSGLLYGTPTKDDVGPVSVAVQITALIDNVPYQDVATIKFNVKHRNHAPAWLTKTIQLPDAHSKQGYSQSLKNSVSDPDNDPLIFTISGPSWLKIDPQTGVLSGTPTVGDVTPPGQPAVWTVTAQDPGQLSDKAQVTIRVIKSNEPPVWTMNPITLKDVAEDSMVSTDLAAYAKDADGDVLTFTKMDGPDWISVNSRGIMMGTPRTANVGPVSFTVRVDDNVSGSALTKVSFLVTPVNHPPFWSFSPIVLASTEDKAVKVDISGYGNDVDSGDKGKLVYSVISAPTPAWASIDAKGVFTGTPGSQSIGSQNYKVRVADQAGAFADVDVIFNVTHVNHAPKWANSHATLTPNAKEDSEYKVSLAQLVSDVDPQDQGKLSFEKAGNFPAWLTLTADGSLSGTPRRADVGTGTFQVRVVDPNSEQAVATFTLTVDLTKHAPKWRQNPVLLSQAFEGLTYQFNLSNDYVTGEAGDTLTYSLINGPRWMAVSANGVITGVPGHNDVGKFTAVIRVADGDLHADANATGEVVQRIQGPVIASNLPTFVVKEDTTLTVHLNDAQYVTNPDGGDLTFGPPTLADWVTLGADGTLLAKPTHANVGDASFNFVVSSAHGSANGVLHLRVLGNGTGQPPVWSVPQIGIEMPAGKQYTGTVANLATDPGGKALTFAKVDGKMWLTVAGDGTITAVPLETDVGVFNFTLSACNADNACATEPLVVTVTGGTSGGDKTVVVDLGESLPNARLENLWVIDNSTGSDNLDKALKSSIATYFDNAKSVASAGVYLSADADQYDHPITGTDESLLLLSSQGNVALDFTQRMNASHSAGNCSNCNNSPIWAMHQFYAKAPSLNAIYHKGYFMAGDPMEILIVTNQTDHFKFYAQDASANVYDYLTRFRTFHRNEKLPFRINVIAPAPANLVEKASQPGDATAYQILASQTGGDYFEVKPGFDMSGTLQTYASKASFRANAYAHARNTLPGAPDVASLKVSLGTHGLNGNTGAGSDQWKYDSAKNQVVLNWAAIDSSWVQPGTKLTITYRQK